jgi:hypothetical protein
MFFFKHKIPQICFQTFFDFFRLAISLRMIGCVEMQLGSLEPESFLREIVGKNYISVRNKRIRYSMEFEDIIHKTLSHYGCCEWVLKRT